MRKRWGLRIKHISPFSTFSFIFLISISLLNIDNNAMSAPAYPNLNNAGYKSPLNPFDQQGSNWYECTRYTFGRTYERTGVALSFSQSEGRHGGRWYDLVVGLSKGSVPRSNSIAVWDYGTYGHVAYVEEVNGDNITISEANFSNPTNGLFNGFKVLTTSKMENRSSYTLIGYIYLPSPSFEQMTDCIGNVCWAPKSVSCEDAQSWYRLGSIPYATETEKTICNELVNEIEKISQADVPSTEVQEERWWQSWWRNLVSVLGSQASADDIRQYTVSRTILVSSDGEGTVVSGNGVSASDALGMGYQLPVTETPTPSLPDFTEYQFKLQDTHGNERYTYYLYDEEIEMHHWSTNIGQADWAGDEDDINVRFYLSKGYKARNSDNDWVRIGTENIKKGNLNVGAVKHEWTTFDIEEYFSNGYLEHDHVYNIVVCVDRKHDTDNGDGEVPEMHESNNCTSEAVFVFKEYIIPPIERQALIKLYDSTNGPGWINSTGWKTNPEPCTWYGVSCANGHVAGINLDQNQLSGTIPPEIGNLIKLVKLNLPSNQLSGAIPVEIGNLTNLTYLYLFANRLSGSIPVEIGNLTNLTYLDLAVNQLSGAIPVEIGNLTNLRNLQLSSNRLFGNIPEEIGNLSNLLCLNLVGNYLNGPIPGSIGNLTNLTSLWLYDNLLTGSIPTEIGNLTNLDALYLQDNQLTGSIPKEIGKLTNLDLLYLQQNQLSGSIPEEMGNLINLSLLDLSHNQLSEPIPYAVAKIAPEICSFDNNVASLCVPNTPAYQQIIKSHTFLRSICGLSPSVSCALDYIIPGDIDHNGSVELADAIASLQLSAGMNLGTLMYKRAAIYGIEKIGINEAIYVLQYAAQLRNISSSKTIFSSDYFPLNVGNWYEYKVNTSDSTRNSVSGIKTIGNTPAKMLSYGSGNKEYYTSDQNGVKLYGQFSASTAVDAIFTTPLLLMPHNARVGDPANVSTSSYSFLYSGLTLHANITSTTNILAMEDVQTEHMTLRDCLKVSVQIDQKLVESGQTLAGSTVYYWFHKEIGCVKQVLGNDTYVITASSLNGLEQIY